MTETYRPSPGGPYHDDYTLRVADALSAAVRVLNHATLGSAGVTSPVTVHDVLGSLSAATAGLDQLLGQLAQALQHLQASGRLGDLHGDPTSRARQTLSEIETARGVADTLASRLARAFNATASLHLTDGSEQ
ncbi:hypothetical protein [Nonomuraea typhae]|uniref:Uncharacterized protein n=1 Tax=Nonomuraea typhae TaxID=2603600 RepID=A0ABW7YTT1_9ACTN